MPKFMVDDTVVSFMEHYHWVTPNHGCPIPSLVDIDNEHEIREVYLYCGGVGICPILPLEVDIINNFGDEKDD